MKKVIFILSATVVFTLVYVYLSNIDNKDICLDSGVCKEGLTVNMPNGNTITINEFSCKQYNGTWRSKYNDCYFKN